MFQLLPRGSGRFGSTVALWLAAVVLAACSSGAGATSKGPASTSGGPASSGAAACPSAPDPGNVPDWAPPPAPPPIIPQIIANPGDLTCGDNRLLFSFFDASTNVLAKPDRKATIAIFDLARDPKKAITTVEGTFIWAIQDVRGIYVIHVTFPEAGVYGAEFTTSLEGGPASTIRTTFSVGPSSPTVGIGQKAPSTKTPTAADAGGNLGQISTDTKPDPAFYRISEDAALAKHDPLVVIFATPKFCQSAQCGPTLDRIKPFAAKYPTVDFIHVEPYRLKYESGALQPVLDSGNNLIANDVTNAWGLTGEPWVFVVDRTGTIRASLSLIFSDAELTTALDAVK